MSKRLAFLMLFSVALSTLFFWSGVGGQSQANADSGKVSVSVSPSPVPPGSPVVEESQSPSKNVQISPKPAESQQTKTSPITENWDNLVFASGLLFFLLGAITAKVIAS